MPWYIKVWAAIVNLKTMLAAIGVTVLSISLVYVSGLNIWTGYEGIQALIRNLGSFLFASVALALVWRLFGKRAFLDEVLAKAGIAFDLKSAGIIKITMDPYREIDWKSYFRAAKDLDILFAQGRAWRTIHRAELRKIFEKKGTTVRLILPDPNDDNTVAEFARRFSITPQEMIASIREAETEFRTLHKSTSRDVSIRLEIWFSGNPPTYMLFIFDSIAILVLSRYGDRTAQIPTFVCEVGGSLYTYVRRKFDALLPPEGRAKLVA